MTTALVIALTLTFALAALALAIALGCAVNISRLERGVGDQATRLGSLERQVGAVDLLIDAARKATAHARALMERHNSNHSNHLRRFKGRGD